MVDKRGAAIVQIAVTKPVVINTTSTHPGTSPRSSDNFCTMRFRWIRRFASIAALVIIDSALLTTDIFVNFIGVLSHGDSEVAFIPMLLFIFPLIYCLTDPINL